MNAGEDRHETAFLAMVMFAKVLACNSPKKTKQKIIFFISDSDVMEGHRTGKVRNGEE